MTEGGFLKMSQKNLLRTFLGLFLETSRIANTTACMFVDFSYHSVGSNPISKFMVMFLWV